MTSQAFVWDSNQYALNNAELGDFHQEFIQLVNACNACGKAEFPVAFQKLLEHTQQHFDMENTLMHESGFPSLAEHLAEHERVLGELSQFGKRVVRGNSVLARAYVKEKLPEWFALHTTTMDNALAAHIADH